MELLEQIFVVLAYVAAIGFLVNGLDDLFFDVGFLRYLWGTRDKRHLSIQDLKLVPEQWTAVFVPAWQEGGVVNKMAEYASRVCVYERYDIFIGVYPNDPETNSCVDKLCGINPRIHKVVVPHPGPTSKADCLNWIYRAMRLNEIPGVREYKIIALHDAEDVLHPLVLKVYNYFVPREYDMGQVPVFALELPVLTHWVGNSYVDDFAELHTKDLFVREALGGVVPSAGVGTCFSRAALDRLAAQNNDDPFFVGNLTEDYEVGIRLKRAGFKAGFLSVPVDRIVRRNKGGSGLAAGSAGPPETITEIIAIRESFPSRLSAAIRQRSRWILGISFQTWEQAGWAGTLPMRYTLLRDRRAPLTHLINMIGYAILLFVLAQWFLRRSSWAETHYLRPVFNSQTVLWKIAIVDTWLLGYRAVQKMISVYSIYSLKQAIFSVPRVVIGNLINFVATVRALRTYLEHKLFGRPIVWLKTVHTFPAESELREYTKTIEDLLIEEGLVTHEQIVQALRLEVLPDGSRASAPSSLLRMGLLNEDQFTAIWAKHSGLPIGAVDPDHVPNRVLEQFSETESLRLEALPMAELERRVQMAFREPPAATQLAEVSRTLRQAVQPFLALPSNIAYARHRSYPRRVLPPSRMAQFTERFKEAAGASASGFAQAVREQERTGQVLPDVLLERGLIAAVDARKLWAECLHCAAFERPELTIHKEAFYKVGPCYWWLHRMLPVEWDLVVTAAPPNPQAQQWVARKTGVTARFVAELPRRLGLAAQRLEATFDPDQVLLDSLVGKNLVRRDQLPAIDATRKLTSDPIAKTLLLQRIVTPEQLHETFLEICPIPPAQPIDLAEVSKLAPLLPPGAAVENRCFALAANRDQIVIGLGQIPSKEFLRLLYTRLAGYALAFEALSFMDASNCAAAVVQTEPVRVDVKSI